MTLNFYTQGAAHRPSHGDSFVLQLILYRIVYRIIIIIVSQYADIIKKCNLSTDFSRVFASLSRLLVQIYACRVWS